MITFKQYFKINSPAVEMIYEVKDTKRNRDEMIRAYGLLNYAPENIAHERAAELINKFTKLSPLIDPSYDYFGSPPGNKTYNPSDIFSWARVAKDTKAGDLEGLQNLEAMIANLSRSEAKKATTKLSEKDYDILADTEHATLYRPRSMSASCKLGAGTKWCTSANVNNQFDSYMSRGVVLFYAIEKGKPGHQPTKFIRPYKYAVAMYPDGETLEFFDAEDNKISRSEWEDIFQALGLPVDPAFYKKHGPGAVSLLKSSVNVARSKISGTTQRDHLDGDTNWELLADVFENVKRIFKSKDPGELVEYEKYRQEENMPDEVFLMDVMDTSSMGYFTDREYNPAGSNNWANSQFQQEIVRNIGRLTHLINQSNSDDWKQEDIQDMDDLTRQVRGPDDGDTARGTFHELRMYISRHLNDDWSDLEKALLKHWAASHDAVNIKVMGGYSEQTAGPFDSTYMWFRLLMDIKNGEWPELEQMIHQRVKSVLHTGDKDPDFDNRKDGIQSMGRSFNNASNFYRRVDTTDRRAWLPQSDEHFKRYMDGEWDMDGPPLLSKLD